MSQFSDTLANLLKTQGIANDRPDKSTLASGMQTPSKSLASGQQVACSSEVSFPAGEPVVIDNLLTRLLNPPVLQAELKTNPNQTSSSNFEVSKSDSQTEQTNKVNELEKKLFSPLRYPERLVIFTQTNENNERSEVKIDDELQLRRYIATSIESLDDDALRHKIVLYQKLGVFIRVCESEVVRIGQKRNKKFLERDEDRSYINLQAKQPTETTPKISAEEKWIKKMTGLGLSREKAKGMWDLKEGKVNTTAALAVSDSLKE